MILGTYILTELGINLKKIKHVIEADDGNFIGSTAHIVDLGAYRFEYLNIGKLNLKNILLALTSKKYMSQNMFVLLLKDCAHLYMPNKKKQIYKSLCKISVNI